MISLLELLDDIKNPITLNDDNKVKRGYNKVFLDGKKVAAFGIGIMGDVPTDPAGYFEDHKIYPNSIFFKGGFIVEPQEKNKNIGRDTIKLIFKQHPEIENIFLYALRWQGAVEFWLKIGGNILLEDKEKELVYIQLNRDKIK